MIVACWFSFSSISIHAPARGATTEEVGYITTVADFNPRSREGSDLFAACPPLFPAISIHAPARGATLHCFRYFDLD